MSLQRVLPFAQSLLKNVIKPCDIVVDATIGNGHDTLFLAQLVGENGHVYGFDVQEAAIVNTWARLEAHQMAERVTLVHKSHGEVLTSIPAIHHSKVSAAIFNLGYLPGGDKQVITKSHSTILALEGLLDILAPHGLIILVIYHGHEGGVEERDNLLRYVTELDQKEFNVLQYQFINQQNSPPFLIALEKKLKK